MESTSNVQPTQTPAITFTVDTSRNPGSPLVKFLILVKRDGITVWRRETKNESLVEQEKKDASSWAQSKFRLDPSSILWNVSGKRLAIQ